MTTSAARFANELWHWAAWPQTRAFWQASTQPEVHQAQLLRNYLRANAQTVYGQLYQFDRLRTVADFQRHVPLTTYDDYAALIARIGEGEAAVLTRAPVQMFELSSGSTTPSKLIPYTATLKAEFQRGLAPWISALFAANPQLKRGPAYWSISPLLDGRRTTPAGLPIGFEQDSAYLGPLGHLIERGLAVPSAVKQLSDITTFRYVTLRYLLHTVDLRMISVWNPTFLTLLLQPLTLWWPQLLADLAQGTLNPPTGADQPTVRALAAQLRPDRARAKQLERIAPQDYRRIWPHLQLLSCWADGPATPFAQQLSEQFPGVLLQGKGLLATEAFVSWPYHANLGSLLAITSHFFEFIAANGEPKLAHQLQRGEVYEVVVTTGGGFYRYQLHDLVEVVGHVAATPLLRFLGKADHTVDQFGEKLHEPFVAAVLDKLYAQLSLSPRFALLAPTLAEQTTRYTLYLELPPEQQHLCAPLAAALDQALCANFHYAYCRQLGQLAEVQVVMIYNGAENYLRACQQRGQKLGNIKPTVLDKATKWHEWFRVGA